MKSAVIYSALYFAGLVYLWIKAGCERDDSAASFGWAFLWPVIAPYALCYTIGVLLATFKERRIK